MKWFSLFIFILFNFNKLNAQSSNANWELKTVEIYSDGMRLVQPSIPYHSLKTFKNQIEFDSISKLNNNLSRNKIEKFRDSVDIERYKANNFNKRIDLVAIEYWLKPKREITSIDTFEISNYIGATFINITPTKESNIGIVMGKNQSHTVKSEYRIQYTKDEIFKSKIQDGYYFLGRYQILENSSFSLRYFSSDSTLEFLHDWNCNIPHDEPYVFAILPNKYMWFATEISNKFTKDSNRSYFDSMPDFSWNNTGNKMEIDTTFTNKKIVVDTINSKQEYRILKQYLERPKELILDSRNNSILILLTNLKDSAFFQYKLVPWIEYTGENIKWENGAVNRNAIEIKNIPIGTYLLYIKDSISGKVSQGYKITVLPRWYQTIVFKIIIGLIVLIGLLFLLFKLYQKKQKYELKKIEQYKTTLDINLKSVRSQLNPHFIFNALNSIQGLITTTQYEKANEYLIEFSNMLRKPLNADDVKHWTLNDEIELLKSYIKIEQLRTPFELNFSIDKLIEKDTINFPILLLQPIVENAIKHALTHDKNSTLNIEIIKNILDLDIKIQDNGKGFELENDNSGNGLKLTKEYINLINQQYPHCKTSMRILSSHEGTTINIKLENWIDE